MNLAESLGDEETADSVKIMIARAIGYGKLANFYPLLLEYLKDDNPAISKQAILSAGTSQEPFFVRNLLAFLPSKSTRPTARKALARYEPSEILPQLVEISSEKEIKTDLLIQLPFLAESMDTQEAVDFLFGLVQHSDPTAKLEALEALHKIKVKFPHLTISGKRLLPILMEEADLYRDTLAISYAAEQNLDMYAENSEISIARKELIKLLERRLDNNLERIFWVLGLQYRQGMILPLYKDIRHTDHNIRMNTVELLDNILDPQLKKVIIPIVETVMHDNKSSIAINRLELDIPSILVCFESLFKGEDDQIKLAVLALIDALDHPDYIPVLELAAKDDHAKVKSYAEKLLATE